MGVVGRGPRVFSLRESADSETARLVVRDGWDGADRLLIDPGKRGDGTSHMAVEVAYPSPDGSLIAYHISAAGGEMGTIEILDVETGRTLPERIDRTQQPMISWRPDGRSFFYWRMAKPLPGAAPADRYKNGANYLHVIGSDPDAGTPVIAPAMGRLGLKPRDLPEVVVTPGSRWALGVVHTDVTDWVYFVAPLARVKPGKIAWRRVAATSDQVAEMAVHGDRLYALTSLDAPNYRIVSLDARTGTLARAREVVPASDLVLTDIAGARDALYVVALDRGLHRLFRVPWATGRRDEVALPFEGSVRRLVADPRRAGLIFRIEGWTHEPTWYEFVPESGMRQLPIGSSGIAVTGVVAEQTAATSADGTEVPLSIIRRADAPLDGRAPALLSGYGAYGLPSNPTYNPFTLTWVKRGGVYAVCHVRGGGARGKAWHLAGMKANKENGVDDFIACAESLIRRGHAAAARLTATGTSAGGVLVGGAITKRPELFTAAVLRVPVVNIARFENTAVGPANAAEFGSVNVEKEVRHVLASDPYHRVREGVDYPAVLLTAGLTDPRVPPWQPAKLAARFQATGRARPTLLRVESDAGHGFGSTETQLEEEFADIYAVALWRSGVAAMKAPSPDEKR